MLIVLDDLTFGPVFWLLGLWGTPGIAAVAAFVIQFVIQIYMVWQGTRSNPARPAAFLLNRLNLERRSSQVASREKAMHGQVAGAVSAVLFAPLIGGVIPPMLLWRNGYSQQFVRRLSLATAAIYATEFAFLHGLLPAQLR